MRTICFLVFMALGAVPGPATAQETIPPLPPSAPLSGESEHCVEVEIGNDKAYNCLNEKLKRETDRTVPLPNIPPLDAKSSDTKIGIVNVPAVKQQYGKNFGKSVIPYRPSKP
jgi:hypothetical protein